MIGSSVSKAMTASNIAVLAQSIATVLEAGESLTSGCHFGISVLIVADKTCFL